MCSFSGTFAVISLMTAQAIEGVPQTSLSVANESDASIMSDKISTATTLALLVGLVQVNLYTQELDLTDSLLVDLVFFTIGIFNSLSDRTIHQWFYNRCGYTCFD